MFWFTGLFEIMFILVFILVISIIIFGIIRVLTEWNKNNHSPRLTVLATVVSKRTSVSHHHHNVGASDFHTSYYVTFQVESGDRLELHVSGVEFGMMAEGDFGKLMFQGTRFLSFQRNIAQ